jgi:hypothetical protein
MEKSDIFKEERIDIAFLKSDGKILNFKAKIKVLFLNDAKVSGFSLTLSILLFKMLT